MASRLKSWPLSVGIAFSNAKMALREIGQLDKARYIATEFIDS